MGSTDRRLVVHLAGVSECVPDDPAEIYVTLPVEKAGKVTCEKCKRKIPREKGSVIKFRPSPRSRA